CSAGGEAARARARAHPARRARTRAARRVRHRGAPRASGVPGVMFSSDVQSIITTLMGDGDKEGDVIKKALRTSESLSILKSAQGEKEARFTLSELSKTLAIVAKMSEAGYAHDKTIAICKAIFVDMSDANLDAAFEMFDTDKGGTIDAAELRQALPLMGENVPE
ncbi:unnamed protein product, partial [Prorocentrum cordatum]